MKLLRRRTTPGQRLPVDPWHRVRVGLGILGTVMAVGVVGYRLLGLDLFDAFYQTAITVTTVGFGETGPADEIDRSYRVFTLGLVFFGVSGALYTLGVMVDAFVEGSLNDGFRVRKDQRMIDKMNGHLIIAGGGRVGQAIAHYLSRHNADLVVIDREPHPDADHPVVIGEASDDDILRLAGIDRAGTLVAALDSDADNVYVTLSARALNPDLFIVARTDHQSNEAKFFQAGADRVVNPHEIGGSRMAALALHPTLAEFLDEVLHDDGHDVRIAEVVLPPSSPLVGATRSAATDHPGRPLLLAVRTSDHSYVANPPPDLILEPDSVLVVLGTLAQIGTIRAAVVG